MHERRGGRFVARGPHRLQRVEQRQIRPAGAHEILGMDLDEAELACTGEHLVEMFAVQAQPR